MKIYIKNLSKKKSFLVLGILNFLITNIILQLCLLLYPIYLSTTVSQISNLLLGLYLYGKKVFRVKKITFPIFLKYFLLAFVLWCLNFLSILFLFNLGINKNISALLVIPILVVFSYFSQNRYVFK